MRDFTCSNAHFDTQIKLDDQIMEYFDQKTFMPKNNLLVNRISQDKRKMMLGINL